MSSGKVTTQPHGPGQLITLHGTQLRATFSTLGAAVVSVQLKHKGAWTELNCQFGNNYKVALEDPNYIGVTVGRFAGRIQNGKFHYPGETREYPIATNLGPHVSHGGPNAFSKKQWQVEQIVDADPSRLAVVLSYVSPHGENGFPGEVLAKVTYEIPAAAPTTLDMYYWGEVTQGSPVPRSIMNMFNHNYWNLHGVPPHGSGKKVEKNYSYVLHMPHATKVAEADRLAMPTGRFLNVSDYPTLDFTKPKRLGDGIHDAKTLNRDPCGYDHPFLIDGYSPNVVATGAEAADAQRFLAGNKNFALPRPLLHHATVSSPLSGIGMTMYSTMPCMWLYTSNNLPTKAASAEYPWTRHDAIGLEPQHFPDAINHPTLFADATVVTRGTAPYREVIRCVFGDASAAANGAKL